MVGPSPNRPVSLSVEVATTTELTPPAANIVPSTPAWNPKLSDPEEQDHGPEGARGEPRRKNAPSDRVLDNRTPRWDNGASRARASMNKHRGGRHDSLSRKVRGLQAGLTACGR